MHASCAMTRPLRNCTVDATDSVASLSWSGAHSSFYHTIYLHFYNCFFVHDMHILQRSMCFTLHLHPTGLVASLWKVCPNLAIVTSPF